jgi:fermentation-respiration switch protein FrsA (DUF1100 family)
LVDMLVSAASAYVLMLVLLLLLENRIIFLPSREHVLTPAAAGVAHEDVTLTTSDGIRIHAWYLPAAPAAGATPAGAPPLGTVLFLHGNAGNISHRLENGIHLTRLGLAVLLVDYRGYGRSEGSPDEAGVYRDADAAYDYLMRRPDASPDRLVIFGRSLGAGPAVDLAVRRRCRALVIESAFCSTRALARELFPYSLFAPFIPDRFRSLAKIRNLACPLLVVHGTRDEIIPYRHGRALYEAAPDPKRFLDLEGAYHNDWYHGNPERYFAAWRELLGSR